MKKLVCRKSGVIFVPFVEVFMPSITISSCFCFCYGYNNSWSSVDYRLFVNLARHNVMKDFSANRVVKHWNHLPVDVDFGSINRFKRSLDRIDFNDYLIIV